jgi:hypothetical protein
LYKGLFVWRQRGSAMNNASKITCQAFLAAMCFPQFASAQADIQPLSYVILAEYGVGNKVMTGGLNRRVFNKTLVRQGDKITLQDDGCVSIQPGTFRISGFSMVTMQTTLVENNAAAYPTPNVYPGYSIVHESKYSGRDAMNHSVAIGSVGTALYSSPSHFDSVATFAEPVELCVGHQAGEVVSGVYMTFIDGDSQGPSAARLFAQMTIFELGSNETAKTEASPNSYIDFVAYPAGPTPAGMAVGNGFLWVSNFSANTVTKIEAASGTTVGTFAVGTNPTGAVFAGDHVWVSNSYYTSGEASRGSVSKIRADTGETAGVYPVGKSPFGITFDGVHIWVANGLSDTVSKLRADSGEILGTFAVGHMPTAVICDNAGNVWVANGRSNNVMKLAPDGTVLGSFAVGGFPGRPSFDGTHVWVPNEEDNTVSKLALGGELVGTYPAGMGPHDTAFDGRHIWVVNNRSGSVSKLLASTGDHVATFTVGKEPRNIAFDGFRIWVGNSGDDTVSRF